jgi:ParB-like chromosome segregation protein Spo0J
MTEQKFMGKREYERTQGKKKEHLAVSLDKVFVREGFNPRDMKKPKTLEKIARLKEAYLAGRHVPMIEVSLVKNRLEIVEGEGRYTAACQAHAEMVANGLPGIVEFHVIWFEGNDAEKTLAAITSSDSEKLLPIEICDHVVKLFRFGWDSAKIEASLGYSRQWVDTLLYMAKLPELIKQAIRHDKISSDVAIALYKKHDEDAVEIIQAMIDGSGVKVTAKSLPKKVSPAVAAYPHVKTIATCLPKFDMATDELVDDQEYTLKLTGKTFRALLELQKHAPS